MEEYPIRNTSKEYTEEYISLREATKYCPYSGGYLKLRARQGKLKAVKFGRNWVTKKEWIEEYLKKNQKSNIKNQKLTDPMTSKFVFIWKEFFKIRQPRFAFTIGLVFVLLLAGIVFGKPGSEFLTRFATLGFLKENPVKNLLPGKESFKSVFEDLDSFAIRFNEDVDGFLAPLETGFLMGFHNFRQGLNIVLENIGRRVSQTAKTLDAVVIKLNEGVDKFFADFGKGALSVSEDIGEGLNRRIKQVGKAFFTLGEDVKSVLTDLEKATTKILATRLISQQTAEVRETSLETIKGFFSWLGEEVSLLSQRIVKGLKEISLFKKKPETAKEKLIPKPTKEGMVVIPSTRKDEEVKEKIKESFSDEVKIEPRDETSGIIIPIFREREGEKYLYILVPIHPVR